jgi:Uncharacterized protein conserved in bacteria, prophage-related
MNPIVEYAISLAGTKTRCAEIIGVSRAALDKWLNNRAKISPEKVYDLSDATNGKFQPHEIRPDLPRLFPHP